MAEQVGSIFSTVSVNIGQLGRGIRTLDRGFKEYGTTLRSTGGYLKSFGNSLTTTLGIALRWYAAYRLIRGVLGAVGRAFKDIKTLEIEAIFTQPALAGEHLANVLAKVSPLARKWGIDVIETYRAVLQFSRALGDMYEMDLPQALALTDIAMKTTVATGQNLNESISNMVGYIRILGLESVKDIDKFMGTLYVAAYRTNEALAEAGKRVQGGAIAMDTLTDAVQRMLPSMVRFGLSWEQIAAIASVFITNLDEAGQGIGAYSAKLFEAIKNNQKLNEVYQAVGITLTRQSGQLIPSLVAGYEKMTDAQKDVAAAATRVGIGAHIVATFWESLTQIQERSLDIKHHSNLLDTKAIELMGTLQKKQDQLRISQQLLSITMMRTFQPALKGTIDFLRGVTEGIELLGSDIGSYTWGVVEYNKQLAQVIWYKITGQVKELEQAVKRLDRVDRIVWESMQDTRREVLGIDEELLKQYAEMELKLQAVFKAARLGMKLSEALTLEKVGKTVKNFTRDINIATYALGPYASEVEKAAAKLKVLKQQLKELESKKKKEPVGTPSAVREMEEALAKTRYQIQEQERILLGISLTVDDISIALSDIAVTGLMGVIEGTKTWRNILEDIGQYTVQEIIEGLVKASLIGETLRGVGKNIWNILGTISSLSGFLGGPKTPKVTAPVWAHEGGLIRDLIGKIPSYQFGGEVLGLLKPSEYVVREGPAQKYKGLLEAINAGKDVGGSQSITYNIYAVDPRSFAQMLYGNKASIHRVVQEAQRFRIPGFRGGEG